MKSKLLLDIEEARKSLGIGRSHLFDLIRRGEITSVKIGRRRLIPADALTDYLDRLIAEQCVTEHVGNGAEQEEDRKAALAGPPQEPGAAPRRSARQRNSAPSPRIGGDAA